MIDPMNQPSRHQTIKCQKSYFCVFTSVWNSSKAARRFSSCWGVRGSSGRLAGPPQQPAQSMDSFSPGTPNSLVTAVLGRISRCWRRKIYQTVHKNICSCGRHLQLAGLLVLLVVVEADQLTHGARQHVGQGADASCN